MLAKKNLLHFWDVLSTFCFLNLICFCAFYLSSVFLTEPAIPGKPEATNLLAYSTSATFIVGFFTRPLGALWFGLRADLISYTLAIKESVQLLTISTALMAILPLDSTYIFAVLRALQGIGIGGCYACLAVYLYELSPVGKKGQTTGILQASVPVGYLTALLLVLVLKMLFSPPLFHNGAWRIAFVLPLLGYLMYRKSVCLRSEINEVRFPYSAYLERLQLCLKTLKADWKALSAPPNSMPCHRNDCVHSCEL